VDDHLVSRRPVRRGRNLLLVAQLERFTIVRGRKPCRERECYTIFISNRVKRRRGQCQCLGEGG
jgi:hypothetical protein